jgi:hypothetical protein
MDERNEVLLRCGVALLEARTNEEPQLGARAQERMIAADAFVTHLGVPLVSFDDGTIDVERETRATGHRVQQMVHHRPESPLAIGTAVAPEPIADRIAGGIAVAFGQCAVGLIVLKQTDIFQTDGTVDHHLYKGEHIVAGWEPTVGTGCTEGTIDLGRQLDGIAEPID